MTGLRRRRHGDPAVRTDAEHAADVAGVLHRVAVLLEAGIAPDRAWEHVAASGDVAAVQVVARRAAGEDLVDAIAGAGRAWIPAAAAWRVAATVGAPLARSLRGIADALREAARTRDDVRVALAEPAATARLIAWLPLAGLVLAIALGFDVVATVQNPIALGCVGAGVVLMLVAARWTRRLVRSADPPPDIPGLSPEVLAIALSGGVSIDRADEVVTACGVSPDRDSRDVLGLSAATGAPAIELLRATAALARHRARVAGRMRAAELSSRLLLPLGTCTLPAFLLVGVAPMLLSVVGSAPLVL